ncbi:MAG: glycosyltransferase family 2 protein [Anaerolineae bacterium]
MERVPDVSVIILTWNRRAWTTRCLESVRQLDYPKEHLHVIVVDNQSSDDTVAVVRDRFPEVELIVNPVNLGYAEGNNVGIRRALERGTDYVLLLNNDVTLATDALTRLVEVAEQHQKAAFSGPKIFHLDRPDRIQTTGGFLDYLWRAHQRGLDELDSGRFDRVEEVDYVIGAAVLIRASLLPQIGLLDPRYYLYYEDTDWCLRARRMGYSTLFVPQAHAWHRSHHVRESELPRITYYMARNSLLLVRENGGGAVRFVAVFLRHLLTALTWTIKPKWRHKRTERDALLRGLWDYFMGRTGRGYL